MQPPPGKPRVPPPPPPGSAYPPPPPRPASTQPGPARAGGYPAPAPTSAPFPDSSASPPHYGAGGLSPALAAHAMQMPQRKRPGRGFLRFFAVNCMISAWLGLIVMVLVGLGSFGSVAMLKMAMATVGAMSGGMGGGMSSPMPDMSTDSEGFPTGGAGGAAAGGPNAAQALLEAFGPQITMFAYASGILSIVSGICIWIFFVGCAKLTYGYLDLEEQAQRDHEAVQILLASASNR